VNRISSDESFSETNAQQKVKEQLEWIAHCNVDAILITCTNYIAILQEDQLSITIPIFKIDEPFFHYLCEQELPQILLFSNPSTVEGTMKRLNAYAQAAGKQPQVEVKVIHDSFELLLQGRKEQYLIVLSNYIRGVLATEQDKRVSVAQLSMVDAVRNVQQETKISMGNPLATLVSYLEEHLLK